MLYIFSWVVILDFHSKVVPICINFFDDCQVLKSFGRAIGLAGMKVKVMGIETIIAFGLKLILVHQFML